MSLRSMVRLLLVVSMVPHMLQQQLMLPSGLQVTKQGKFQSPLCSQQLQ